jgi:hypothetical protein
MPAASHTETRGRRHPAYFPTVVDVSQLTVEAQPTAVIAEATSWEAYPEL